LLRIALQPSFSAVKRRMSPISLLLHTSFLACPPGFGKLVGMGVRSVQGRWVMGLGAAGALLLLTGLAAQASIVVNVLSPPRTVSPGNLAIHVFAVSHTGQSPIQVTLELVAPPGWGHLGLPPSLSLAPGDEQAVFVTVIVSRGAAAGPYRVRLVVGWPEGEASAEATVHVIAVAGVDLVPPRKGEVQPGDSVTYELSLVNRGNVLDRFSVDASSAHGWAVRVEPQDLTLRPGQRATVRLTLSVPAHTEPGRDLLSVAVRSQEGAEARTAWFTMILPPGPEAIGGTVLAELDMRLGGRLGYDPISDRRLSLITLSGDGEVLGGEVNLMLHATGPWDPAPYSLSRFSFSYDQGSAWVDVGEVGLRMSSLLLSLGVAGMLAGVRTDHGEAALLTGWLGDEGRFGLRGAWLGAWGQLGLAVRETRGEDHVRAGTLWISGRIFDGLDIRSEGGVAFSGPFLDTGFLVGLTAEAGTALEFQADAFAVGPWFPSARADRAGVTMSGEWDVDGVGLRLVAHGERDNVLGIATVPTTMRSELSTAFDWALAEWPLAVYAGAALRRGQGFGPGPRQDWRTRILDLAVVAGESPLVLRLSGRWRWEDDFTVPTTERIEEYGQRFVLTLGRTRVALTLTQTATRDGVGEIVTAASLVSLYLRTAAGVAVDFRHSRHGGHAGVEIPFSIAPAWSVLGRLDIGWDAGGEVNSVHAVIGFEYAFLWTPPFLPAKGWLEGTVFVDDNGDGRRDPGEAPVGGAVLTMNRVTVASGDDGRFLFPPLAPGAYAITLERLPPGFRARTDLPLRAEVVLAGRTRVEIACERVGEISGTVYDDVNRNEIQDAAEAGLRGVTVILDRDGVQVSEVRTAPLGTFSFTDLPGGEYEVRIDVRSLPDRYELTTAEEVVVRLEPGATAEVLFGAWERPRPVVIVYQPPVADFTWSPPTPRVGQPVTFDAGTSLGEIVRYQWEFTGDDVFDAEGVAVTWTFPEPGFYLVALVVTDRDGLEDRIELLVVVVA